LTFSDDQRMLRLAHYANDECDGRCNAVILDEGNHIAVMLEDCGDPVVTLVKAGALVKYFEHPEAEPRIVGSHAYVTPFILGGRRVH